MGDGLDYRDLAEALPHPVWITGPDGRLEHGNRALATFTGVAPAQLVGSAWLARVHPDDLAQLRGRWDAAMAAPAELEAELRIERRDGQYRWFRVRMTPLGVRWVGSAEDIHDLRDARELATLAEEMQAAQRITNVGSWSFEIATNTVTWSDELFRIMEMERTPLAPAYADQKSLYTEEAWERLDAAVSKALVDGQGYQLDLDVISAKRTHKDTVARAVVVRDASGTITHLTGSLQDVTEMRRLTARLQLATTAAQFGVWDLDLVTGTLVWDEAMYRIYQTTPAEFGSDLAAWRGVVHPEDADAAGLLFERAIAGDADFHITFRIGHASGNIRYVRAMARVHRDPDTQRALRLVGVNHDVTAQVLAEKALIERSAQREVLLQEVHHRVKNNLQVIASLINLQVRQLTDDVARTALEQCGARIQAIGLVHEQLYQTQDYTRLALSDFVKVLVENIRTAAGPSSVRFDVSIDETSVSIDKAIPLGLILNELLTNALKHGFPAGRTGTIRVRLRRAEELCLVVEDDGVGLPEGLDVEASSSLGLRLVRRLVKQLEGRLEVERATGARFSVWMPLSE